MNIFIWKQLRMFTILITTRLCIWMNLIMYTLAVGAF